jgi:hypothetical protein
MKTRLIHILDWTLSNALYWILTGLAFFRHISWAFNLWVFLTWCFTLIWGFIALSRMGYRALGQEDQFPPVGRSVPAWVSIISDVGIACVAAAFGHWFYAVLLIVQTLLEGLARGSSSSSTSTTSTPTSMPL